MDPKKLREATRAEHEATESLMPLTGPRLTQKLYVDVLATLAPLVLGWERWAEVAVPAGLRELLRTRQRGPLLLADLAALGAGDRVGRVAEADWAGVVGGRGEEPGAAPEFEAAFLGALYVMEGSTLGGRFLARHAEAVLGLVPGQGDAYFVGHGEATGAMWREVTARIAEVPEALAPVVEGAARRTFQAFGEALRQGDFVAESVRS